MRHKKTMEIENDIDYRDQCGCPIKACCQVKSASDAKLLVTSSHTCANKDSHTSVVLRCDIKAVGFCLGYVY
jgi:hypothetical protein